MSNYTQTTSARYRRTATLALGLVATATACSTTATTQPNAMPSTLDADVVTASHQLLPTEQATSPSFDQLEPFEQTTNAPPVPTLEPAPEPPATTHPVEPSDDDGLVITDVPIGTVPSPVDPSVFEPVALCSGVAPAGSLYATSQSVDALGDGSANDTATLYFDEVWTLRLDVANGPSSQLEFGDDASRWHALDGVARIGDNQAEQIVMNEKGVGEAYSFAHLIGVDDSGCLAETSSTLQGVTGNYIHSLECDAAGGTATYVSFALAGVSGSYEMHRSELRADGSTEKLPVIIAPGTDPLVVRAGANNCG